MPASVSPTVRLTSYQRFVVFAAWLGLGFDLMDSVLFNFVGPTCVPRLLGLAATDPRARGETGFWIGLCSSVMLAGWAVGGVGFGRVSDRVGRARTVVGTMLCYAIGTAACALAPNLATLTVFRFVAALGIGGEWAAGAALVAETVPEERRVQMGALLGTSAPVGIFFAIGVHELFMKRLTTVAVHPDLAWRLVLAAGILPALFALAMRRRLREPEPWLAARARGEAAGTVGELFTREHRGRTASGLGFAGVSLLTFWGTMSFLPLAASLVAERVSPGAAPALLGELKATLITRSTLAFNAVGVVGVALTAPLALALGRRRMLAAYLAWSAAALWLALSLPESPATRVLAFALIGLSTAGVMGAFQFYLTELFPTRLRATGAGFCMNAGRLAIVPGPFVIGLAAQHGVDPIVALRWLAIVPLVGVLAIALGFGKETRGRALG